MKSFFSERFAVRTALPVRTKNSINFSVRPLRCETAMNGGLE